MWRCSLSLCALFFAFLLILENAVSVMLITKCTLAEPLLDKLRRSLRKSVFEIPSQLDLFTLGHQQDGVWTGTQEN